MTNDLRTYNYPNNDGFIPRNRQIEIYIQERLKDINVNTDLTEITHKVEDVREEIVNTKTDVVKAIEAIKPSIEVIKPAIEALPTKKDINISTDKIVEAIKSEKDCCDCCCEDNKKEQDDICCNISCIIEEKLDKAKCELSKDIEEKFLNINDLIRRR